MLLHIRPKEVICCVNKKLEKQETKQKKQTNNINNNNKQANKRKGIKEKVEFGPPPEYPIVRLKKRIFNSKYKITIQYHFNE